MQFDIPSHVGARELRLEVVSATAIAERDFNSAAGDGPPVRSSPYSYYGMEDDLPGFKA